MWIEAADSSDRFVLHLYLLGRDIAAVHDEWSNSEMRQRSICRRRQTVLGRVPLEVFKPPCL